MENNNIIDLTDVIDLKEINTLLTVTETDRLLTVEEMNARDESCVLRWNEMNKPWSDPVYVCPKCGEGGMCRENNVVYTSNPPQYRYKCNKCEHTEYRYS